MDQKSSSEGAKVLIVDDEPDVSASLKELLWMCDVTEASTFEQATELLKDQYFDFAILDIMGVKGFELLALCREKGVTAVMLTAHALTTENIFKSFEEGAASFIPKEEMVNITDYLNDIVDARRLGKHPWWRWLDRITERFLERKFGPNWKKKNGAFWENLRSDRL